MRRTVTGTVAIALSMVAVALWLLSYSWLLGLVLPADVSTRILSEETLSRLGVSPWLVVEVAAIPVGLGGSLLGLLAVRSGVDSRRKWLRAASVLGAGAALLCLASLLAAG